MSTRRSSVLLSAFVLCGVACSSDASSGFSDEMARDAPGAPGGDFGAGSGSSGGADGLPIEREVESDYEAPVATGKMVWLANPKSGRVALVDAVTFQVRTVEAGNGPTYLASIPGQDVDTTLVLNVLSEDATLLRATSREITSATFKTARHANTVVASSDGRFAIAWADARRSPAAPKTEGFQDLTIIDLVNGTSTILAVGYRPVTVGFVEGSLRAHAVTQDGIAVVDLAATPRVVKNVAISNTPTDDPGTRDVFVTKDGKQAFVRRDGSASITVVGLDADTRTDVPLSGEVTDLDLADSGDRAVAVVRQTAEVAVLPVADPTNPTSLTVTGETIGSVAIAPGGGRALLFTNSAAVERFTILDIGQAPALRTVRLYSPVLGVFSAPDAQHAIVLHDTTGIATGGGGAFSVVPIGKSLPAKIVATNAPPSAVALTNDRGVVAERDDARKVFGAYVTRMPELMVEHYALASPPIAVGIVEGAKRAFVSQQHPEGRLTFIDLESGVARTLTGFELSSRVVDGSTP